MVYCMICCASITCEMPRAWSLQSFKPLQGEQQRRCHAIIKCPRASLVKGEEGSICCSLHLERCDHGRFLYRAVDVWEERGVFWGCCRPHGRRRFVLDRMADQRLIQPQHDVFPGHSPAHRGLRYHGVAMRIARRGEQGQRSAPPLSLRTRACGARTRSGDPARGPTCKSGLQCPSASQGPWLHVQSHLGRRWPGNIPRPPPAAAHGRAGQSSKAQQLKARVGARQDIRRLTSQRSRGAR